jgi:uncharacterized protein
MELFGFDLSALLPFIAVGFFAQLIDGSIGMAFGVITNTMLVTMLGMPPAQASARVHLVEMFTTAASGLSHVYHRNVDWKLFSRLAIPGVIGAVTGAYLLTQIDGAVAKPFVMTYLSCIGVYLLFRAWDYNHTPREPKVIAPLALVGGFLDAAGGGGWGPVVTSNLLIQGSSPRMTVGTVNTANYLHQPIGLGSLHCVNPWLAHWRAGSGTVGSSFDQAHPATAAFATCRTCPHRNEHLQPL